MAFFEAAVVVYLRQLIYPEGFSFPLKIFPDRLLVIELCRETATLVMLVAVGWLAGRRRWERFAYFLIAFGVWDIFYYVWLKATIGWPAGLQTWDILFLLPVPWIGPVLAPVAISLVMIAAGLVIIGRDSPGEGFHATITAWTLSLGGSAVILYSFMRDSAAMFDGATPKPYAYWLLLAGLGLYAAAIVTATRASRREEGN